MPFVFAWVCLVRLLSSVLHFFASENVTTGVHRLGRVGLYYVRQRQYVREALNWKDELEYVSWRAHA
jgi:hypothetical protein